MICVVARSLPNINTLDISRLFLSLHTTPPTNPNCFISSTSCLGWFERHFALILLNKFSLRLISSSNKYQTVRQSTAIVITVAYMILGLEYFVFQIRYNKSTSDIRSSYLTFDFHILNEKWWFCINCRFYCGSNQ